MACKYPPHKLVILECSRAYHVFGTKAKCRCVRNVVINHKRIIWISLFLHFIPTIPPPFLPERMAVEVVDGYIFILLRRYKTVVAARQWHRDEKESHEFLCMWSRVKAIVLLQRLHFLAK